MTVQAGFSRISGTEPAHVNDGLAVPSHTLQFGNEIFLLRRAS